MRFIMLDRICEIEKGKTAAGIKNLAMSEDYFADHFPFFPVMPGVLLLEAMVELSRWLILYSSAFEQFGQLETVRFLKLREPAHPGDSLRITVEWREESGPVFAGKVFLQEKMIAEALFENHFAPVSDPDWSRELAQNFQMLRARFKDYLGEQR